MMMRAKHVLAGLWLLVSVAGVSQAHASDLGKDRAGESCRGESEPGSLHTDIFCGNETKAVGRVIVSAVQDASARRAALDQLLHSQDDNFDCAETVWMASAAVGLRVCTLKGTGWSHILIGANAGSQLYLADGPPSAFPALLAALRDDDPQAVDAADLAQLQTTLKNSYASGILDAPASDFGRCEQLIEAARLAGASDRFAVAEADYRDVLSIEERLYGGNSIVVGQTLAELALQTSNQGRFDDAQALFHRAGPVIESSADDGARARLASYLALDAANRRQFEDALKFAREAVSERRLELAAAAQKSGVAGNASLAPTLSQGELGHALRIEAEMELRLGDLAGANADAEEALWIVSNEPGLPLWWRADVVALMGEVNEKFGRIVAAEHDLRDARDLDRKLFGEGTPTAFADLRLARFYTRQQVYNAALDAFRLAFDIAQKNGDARAEISSDDVVAFMSAEQTAGDPAKRDSEMFAELQLVHSGVADQTLARIASVRASDDRVLSGLLSELQSAERDRDLKRLALAAENAKPAELRKDEREHVLEGDANDAAARADQLRLQIRTRFPNYTDLAHPGVVGLSEVQSRLAPDAALVSFVLGESSGYAIVVRSHGFAAVPLAMDADTAASKLRDLRKAFVPIAGRLPEYDLKNAYEFYQKLVAPLGGALDGVDRLTIVPGAALADLPFAALLTAPSAGRDYQNAAWLVRRYSLGEAPSLSAFAALQTEAAAATVPPRPFLGLGNPPFQGANGPAGQKALVALTDVCRQGNAVPLDLLRALPPLPETDREIHVVGASIGGAASEYLVGAQASEANLRARPLDQYAVLYFATHGILPEELHCASEPALALAPPTTNSESAENDGLLEASEIAGLKLNADLVVLSACNTAASTDGQGGGALEGLSDSFLRAGARSVLASHWEVSSSATEILMTDLFEPSHRALGLSGALRAAELDLIGRPAMAHPFYWAAFTIIGNSAPRYGKPAQITEARH